MTKITIELKDLDDCDRATLQGMVARAIAQITEETEFFEHRHISVIEIADHEPLTMRDGDGGAILVNLGRAPLDCTFDIVGSQR